jgi:CheY-like chemotaxis protein
VISPGEKEARPAEIPITLREVLQEEPPAPARQAPNRPVPELLVQAEPFEPPQPDRRLTGDDHREAVETAARRQRRAERRAAVRRARLRSLAEEHADASPPEVLVLDGDAGSRESLCTLLRRFGFVVHAADEVRIAYPIAASRKVVAAFVAIVTDGEDDQGLIDCRRVHDIFERRFGPPAVLVGVAERAQPLDLVRAELAGCAELIVKPVTRGAVARVFDVHDIAMPADARRV